jgi:hypothetical protein
MARKVSVYTVPVLIHNLLITTSMLPTRCCILHSARYRCLKVSIYPSIEISFYMDIDSVSEVPVVEIPDP